MNADESGNKKNGFYLSTAINIEEIDKHNAAKVEGEPNEDMVEDNEEKLLDILMHSRGGESLFMSWELGRVN